MIDDEDKAKLYLLTNNYYNIINGYGKYFPRNGDTYINGTNFNEISHLYFFDKEMKQALFQAIINAEVHLKSSFAQSL
ncbi:Abi-like domain protein [Selenomonas sp. FOBRC9]|nr:Abi-like domain protein [Selenomonas sp. FOBRC9]